MDINTANRLYELRKAKGYSQDELADLIGVSRQAVSKWERGESSPDTDNLISLAKLYGVSIDELLDYQPQNSQSAQNTQEAQDAQSNSQNENDNNTNSQNSNVFVRINSDGIEIHAPHSKDSHIFDKDFDDDVDYDGDGEENSADGEKKRRYNVNFEDNEIRITSNGKKCTKDGAHIQIGNHTKNRNQAIKSAISGCIFVLTLVGYLVMGFVAKLWHPGWIIFFTPIVVDGITDTILKRNPKHFPIPILCVVTFLLLGFLGEWWHPGWVVFLAIPAYYAIVSPIYDACKKKTNACENSAKQDYIDDQQDSCR